MSRCLLLLYFAVLASSCSTQPAGPARAVSQPGDPALDGKAYLLSEIDFRAILSAVRNEIARDHLPLSVRRVHVITPGKVEVYGRALNGWSNQEYLEEDYSFEVVRSSTGWKVTGGGWINIITDLGLTSRCS